MTNEEMVKRIRTGEDSLLNDLIEQNRGMIERTVRRYLQIAERNGGADIDDLRQSATIGIIETVPAWDENKGASFLALAVLYMRKELRNTLGLRGRTRLENTGRIRSLNEPVGIGEDSEEELYELVPDEDAVDPFEEAALCELRRTVREAVAVLKGEPKEVINYYYFAGMPFIKIAGKINKSTTQARRICGEGLRQLRRVKRLIDLYDDYERPIYRDKGLVAFNSSWGSVVEDAAIWRERMRKNVDSLLSELPPNDPRYEEMRSIKALF